LSSSVWDDPKLLDELIDAVANGHSYTLIAEILSKKFNVSLKKGAIAGKVSRLKEDGIVFPEREPAFTGRYLDEAVRDAVHQDIKSGYPLSIIAKRNGVSESYASRQRGKLINNGVPIVLPVQAHRAAPKPRKVKEPRERTVKEPKPRTVKAPVVKKPDPPAVQPVQVVVAPPPVQAVIIPFEVPPAKKATTSKHRCEYLDGPAKPWIRCDNPTAYHTSWCDEHGKIVFNVWPPKSHQEKEQRYG
jgi:hypothetical protein